MMINKSVALVLLIALGSCDKASRNPKPQSLTEAVKVVWPDNSHVQIENKKEIWLFGERVVVDYKFSKSTWREQSNVEVTLFYPARQSGPHSVYIVDYNNDGKADRVWMTTPEVDIRRDAEEQPTRIFHHADLVLAKLRKELRVDEVLNLGPNGLFDPFVQERD